MFRKKLLVMTSCLMLVQAPAIRAEESAKVELNLASTFPGTMPILGSAAHDLTERINRATAGEVEITFHEPGVLVPAADTVKAVAEGTVAAAWAGAGWFAGHDSAFNFFSAVPFGPGIGEYLAWMYQGGGLDFARAMFREHGVYNIPCGMIPPEASGWFRSEMKSPEDLKGLNMRFFGLGALVMEKLGVNTEQVAPGEILAKLKDGSLDATEFSLPAMDKPLGFHTVAKYYYFPGWHQQATFFDLYINLDVWEQLADHHQATIELACGDIMRDMIAKGEAAQGEAIAELQAQGVELRRWPAPMLVAFEDAWADVVAEESAKSENFRIIYESYASFRKKHETWRYLSEL